MKRRIHGALGSVLAAVAAIGFVAAVCVADELQLRNGSKHTGSLVAADENTIVFRLKDRLLTKNRSEVLAIILGESDSGSEAFPPGVSAVAPLKITRCITFHRITNFKPEEMAGINNAKISANGANIIFSTNATVSAQTSAGDLQYVGVAASRTVGVSTRMACPTLPCATADGTGMTRRRTASSHQTAYA